MMTSAEQVPVTGIRPRPVLPDAVPRLYWVGGALAYHQHPARGVLRVR